MLNGGYTTSLAVQAGSDRAPAEVALLVVCGAVVSAVAVVAVRYARTRSWRFGRARQDRAPQDAARTNREMGGEPDTALDSGTGTGGSQWRPGARTLVLAVAVVLVVCGLGAAVVVLGGRHGPVGRSNVAANATPVPGQGPATGPSAGDSKGPGKHPSNAGGSKAPGKQSAKTSKAGISAPGQPASRGGSGSGTSGPATSAPPPPPPTSAPPPAPAAIALPSQPVVLDQINSANPPTFSGYFTLSAVNGPVSYTVTYSPANEITFIDDTSGTVSPGQTVYISIQVTQVDPGSVPFLSVDPGGAIQLELVGCGSEGVSC